MRAVLCALAMAICLNVPSGAQAADQTGFAEILDGDSIRINGTEFRLGGIDAPETGFHCHSAAGVKYNCAQQCKNSAGGKYPCGEEATQYMETMTVGKQVTCKDTGTIAKHHSQSCQTNGECDRHVGLCTVGGTDLNKAMVLTGHAVAYWDKTYEKEEAQAKKAKVGVWQGDFILPQVYRHDKALREQWSAPKVGYTIPPAPAPTVEGTKAPKSEHHIHHIHHNHASSGSSSSGSTSGSVHVEGYTRADGTHVESYTRHAPERYGSSKSAEWGLPW